MTSTYPEFEPLSGAGRPYEVGGGAFIFRHYQNNSNNFYARSMDLGHDITSYNSYKPAEGQGLQRIIIGPVKSQMWMKEKIPQVA